MKIKSTNRSTVLIEADLVLADLILHLQTLPPDALIDKDCSLILNHESFKSYDDLKVINARGEVEKKNKTDAFMSELESL